MKPPPAPFIAAYSGGIDQRLALMADALSRKANITAEPTYSAVQLIAPDGGVWLVTVDDAGALHTQRVTRP